MCKLISAEAQVEGKHQNFVTFQSFRGYSNRRIHRRANDKPVLSSPTGKITLVPRSG